MNKRTLKSALALAASGLMALSLVGCSSGSSDDKTDGNEVLPPQIVAPAELEGESFTITPEQPLVINADEPEKWTGETSDPGVAVFIPGSDDGTTVFNPGFEAVAPGETDATFTSPEGESYSFTIEVP